MYDYPMYPYYSTMTKCKVQPITFPPQHQDQQPGLEYVMYPRPIAENPAYTGSGKLRDRVVLITGGDSGIGRAVAIACAKEGAAVAFAYLYEEVDAQETRARIEQLGGRVLAMKADLRSRAACCDIVEQTLRRFGRLDVLVNNIGVQYPQHSLLDITEEQLEQTFRTNIFSFFFVTQAALPHLKPGSSIINTASVTAYRGEKTLIDYSSTKGAVVSFTRRSLSLSLVDQGIRVNAAHSFQLLRPAGGGLRLGYADEAGRSAIRARSGLCLPGERRLPLRDRRDDACQRRRIHYLLNPRMRAAIACRAA